MSARPASFASPSRQKCHGCHECQGLETNIGIAHVEGGETQQRIKQALHTPHCILITH